MDFDKIFLKDACPTTIGGQAVMEGVAMKGPEKSAIVVRIPDGRLHIKTYKTQKAKSWQKLPLIRGVVAFVRSLTEGIGTLTYSADVLEYYGKWQEDSRFNEKLSVKEDGAATEVASSTDAINGTESISDKEDGEKGNSNVKDQILTFGAVALAILVSIFLFAMVPTMAAALFKKFTTNHIVLNVIEGLIRLGLFVLYIWATSLIDDVKRTYQYHGAEHRAIHCFENNLPLTTTNASGFLTLHPRCGTSFLMFVMLISLVLFSFMGWPSLWVRFVSRVALIPVIAALSYELLRWAGKSDNWFIKIMSVPGLCLQKITTVDPDPQQQEVAIVSLKAVLDSESPYIEGICDSSCNLIQEVKI